MPNFTLYLLHFNEPYPGGQRPQHYLGVTSLGLTERLKRHHTERGASLLRAHFARGGTVREAQVVTFKTKDEAYTREQYLKALKTGYRKFCPFCTERYYIL